MKLKIRTCPICGGPDVLVTRLVTRTTYYDRLGNETTQYGGPQWEIKCVNNFCSMRPKTPEGIYSFSEAVRIWDRRAFNLKPAETRYACLKGDTNDDDFF